MKKMLLLSIKITHAQQVFYVNAGATGANEGSSWTGGFTQFLAGGESRRMDIRFLSLRAFISPLPAGPGSSPFRCIVA